MRETTSRVLERSQQCAWFTFAIGLLWSSIRFAHDLSYTFQLLRAVDVAALLGYLFHPPEILFVLIGLAAVLVTKVMARRSAPPKRDTLVEVIRIEEIRRKITIVRRAV